MSIVSNNKGDGDTSLVVKILTASQEELTSIAYPDTGAQGNFISHSLFTRLGLATELLTRSDDIWDGLSGEGTYSLGTIDLHWYVRDGKQLHTTQFHVIENGRFDIILGKDLCLEKGLFTFHKDALIFVKSKPKPSKGWSCVFTVSCFGLVITENVANKLY
jgi:hypothetical protein